MKQHWSWRRPPPPLVIFAATLGAYGLTRFQFRGKDIGAATSPVHHYFPALDHQS